jgi:hypothetical protein
VDGANIDGVAINNICRTDVRCPVFLRLGNRGRDMEKPTPGTMKNVILSHIVANGAEEPCTLSGMPHHPIESIIMINMRITCKGAGTAEQSQVEVAEHISKYPSAGMFGNLPAYGVYCRHVRNLNLSTIHLGCASSDSRHAVMCDDVSRLLVDSLGGDQAKNGQALLHFRGVRDATVRGFANQKANPFLKISGPESRDILLINNDFKKVQNLYEIAGDAPTDSVDLIANRR